MNYGPPNTSIPNPMMNSMGKMIGRPITQGSSLIAGADGGNYDQNMINMAKAQLGRGGSALTPDQQTAYQGILNATTMNPSQFMNYARMKIPAPSAPQVNTAFTNQPPKNPLFA